MLHKPNRTRQDIVEYESPAIGARRLQLEYSRLQRQIIAVHDINDTEAETDALRRRVDLIARDLGSIRADSVHAVESKLKVALSLAYDRIDKASQKLLASALSDLHYLALISEPPPKRR
jgi:hypothetical protein